MVKSSIIFIIIITINYLTNHKKHTCNTLARDKCIQNTLLKQDSIKKK